MLITLGKINIKWTLFLFVPILLFLTSLVERKSTSDDNLFFYPFLRFFARTLSFIPWVILYKSLKFQNIRKNLKLMLLKKNEDINDDISNELISQSSVKRNLSEFEILTSDLDNNIKRKNDIMKKKYRTNFQILLFTGFMDFIVTTVKFIFINFKYRDKVSGGLTVLSSCARLMVITILSYIFLKREKLKSHQLFSASIILLVVIIITILSFFMEDEENNEKFFLKLIIMFTPEILYCFMYICGAFYLMRSQGNVYKLIFYNGIIGLFLSGVFQLLSLLLKCDDLDNPFDKDYKFCDGENIKTIYDNFKSFKNFGGYLTFIQILVNFIEILCNWLLIFYFSLNHFSAIFIINSFFWFISKENKFSYKIIYIVGCLIIIFMALIYNEIIILKFWGFDKDTGMEIAKRSVEESIIEYDINEEEKRESLISIENDNRFQFP